jgi:hypothetical protein
MLQFCYDRNQNEGDKVILYCDQTAYLKIITYFYKSIFANITAEAAYKISKANFIKDYLVTHREIVGKTGEYEDWLPSLAEFTTVFDNTTVDPTQASTFLSNIGMERSLEYLLASYIYNESFKEEIKSVMHLMLYRHVEEAYKEGWRSILMNIVRKDVQTRFGTREYTIDNLAEVINDPIFDTLKSTNIWRATWGGTNPPRTPLDLTKYSDEEITLILTQVKNSVITAENISHPTIARLVFYTGILRNGEISDQELESIIAFELNPVDDLRFYGLKDEETINIFFVDYVLDVKKYGDPAELAPYLLR